MTLCLTILQNPCRKWSLWKIKTYNLNSNQLRRNYYSTSPTSILHNLIFKFLILRASWWLRIPLRLSTLSKAFMITLMLTSKKTYPLGSNQEELSSVSPEIWLPTQPLRSLRELDLFYNWSLFRSMIWLLPSQWSSLLVRHYRTRLISSTIRTKTLLAWLFIKDNKSIPLSLASLSCAEWSLVIILRNHSSMILELNNNLVMSLLLAALVIEECNPSGSLFSHLPSVLSIRLPPPISSYWSKERRSRTSLKSNSRNKSQPLELFWVRKTRNRRMLLPDSKK